MRSISNLKELSKAVDENVRISGYCLVFFSISLIPSWAADGKALRRLLSMIEKYYHIPVFEVETDDMSEELENAYALPAFPFLLLFGEKGKLYLDPGRLSLTTVASTLDNLDAIEDRIWKAGPKLKDD